MEEKIAFWSTAVGLAAVVALLICGSSVDLAEPETIRSAAEKSAVLLALVVALLSFD